MLTQYRMLVFTCQVLSPLTADQCRFHSQQSGSSAGAVLPLTRLAGSMTKHFVVGSLKVKIGNLEPV